MLIVFFFFKQKTAYELRISDWSSDVCSSDLRSSPGLYRGDSRLSPMTGFPDPSHNWQAALPNPAELRAAYARDGYAVVRGLFSAAEIAVLAAAFDRIWAEGMRLGRSFRHGNQIGRAHV